MSNPSRTVTTAVTANCAVVTTILVCAIYLLTIAAKTEQQTATPSTQFTALGEQQFAIRQNRSAGNDTASPPTSTAISATAPSLTAPSPPATSNPTTTTTSDEPPGQVEQIEQIKNLLPNHSFESGLSSWNISRCTLDPEIVNIPESACIFPIDPLRRSAASKVSLIESGETQHAHLITASGSVRLRSSLVAVEPESLVRFSVRLKAEKILDNAGPKKGGLSLSIHDKKRNKIRHYDFASFSGSFDWKKMNGELYIPADVHFVRLNIELRQTSGELWADDAQITFLQLPDFATIEEMLRSELTTTRADQELDAEVDGTAQADLALRGAIVAGSWFNSAQILDRLQAARFNFAWSQGSFLNQKMQYLWHEPLNATEKEQVQQWIQKCTSADLTCYLSLSPRGQDAENATTYSARKDIADVVSRFDELYALGVRNFGLNFDDLHRFDQGELSATDAKHFAHMGEAHAHFVAEVFKQLTQKYDDVQLMIVPLYYDLIGNLGSNEEAYLYALGELPLEIGMLSSTVFVEDAQTAIRTTGRRHVIWDNQFAFAHEQNGAGRYIAPLYRPKLDESLIAGYAFLPLIRIREDEALISWQSAADYAWSPAEYDPMQSLQRSMQKYLAQEQATEDEQHSHLALGRCTKLNP